MLLSEALEKENKILPTSKKSVILDGVKQEGIKDMFKIPATTAFAPFRGG